MLVIVLFFACKQYRFLVISRLESRDYTKKDFEIVLLAKKVATKRQTVLKINSDENQNRSCYIMIATLSEKSNENKPLPLEIVIFAGRQFTQTLRHKVITESVMQANETLFVFTDIAKLSYLNGIQSSDAVLLIKPKTKTTITLCKVAYTIRS